MQTRKVSLLGIPWDRSSSYAQGAAMGPHQVLGMLRSDASNPYSIGLTSIPEAIAEQRILSLPGGAAEARAAVEQAARDVLDRALCPISVGGDHSVTYPLLRAMRAAHGPVQVLHVDAHPDLYDDFEGDRWSHACPFARALDDGCISRLVQVGIRASTPAQVQRAREHGVLMLGADEIERVPAAFLDAPLYVTIDLDGLDPAFAPGVSHPEPGGLSTRELLALLRRVRGRLLGADVVELNPERDESLRTAGVAVRLVKELIHLAVRPADAPGSAA
jgi:agmatinase